MTEGFSSLIFFFSVSCNEEALVYLGGSSRTLTFTEDIRYPLKVYFDYIVV